MEWMQSENFTVRSIGLAYDYTKNHCKWIALSEISYSHVRPCNEVLIPLKT